MNIFTQTRWGKSSLQAKPRGAATRQHSSGYFQPAILRQSSVTADKSPCMFFITDSCTAGTHHSGTSVQPSSGRISKFHSDFCKCQAGAGSSCSCGRRGGLLAPGRGPKASPPPRAPAQIATLLFTYYTQKLVFSFKTRRADLQQSPASLMRMFERTGFKPALDSGRRVHKINVTLNRVRIVPKLPPQIINFLMQIISRQKVYYFIYIQTSNKIIWSPTQLIMYALQNKAISREMRHQATPAHFAPGNNKNLLQSFSSSKHFTNITFHVTPSQFRIEKQPKAHEGPRDSEW